MAGLSVVIICYNEQAILGRSLSAVNWADEIVVVDAFSTDQTVEIAKQYTRKVFQHPWQGYGNQKNLALGYVSCPWVLSLDADEVVSPELAQEIQRLLEENPIHTGYRIPRMTHYLGRFLRHVWYPDYKMRLFLKDRVVWGGESVHERVHLDGSAGKLVNPLLHFSFPSIREHIQTLQRYTALGAADLAEKGRSFSRLRLLGSPVVMFWKQFIMKRGFLDGLPGLIACVLSGVHEFVKYAKLYELEKSRDRNSAEPGAEKKEYL